MNASHYPAGAHDRKHYLACVYCAALYHAELDGECTCPRSVAARRREEERLVTADARKALEVGRG